MIGANAEQYPNSVKEIVSHGHVIANHSYGHSYMLPFESRSKVQNDLLKTEDVIYSITGLRTRLFRPPHGLRTPWFLRDIRSLQYSTVTWNDMTNDWNSRKSPEKIWEAVIAGARPGGIIDLHDGKELSHVTDRSNTVLALPVVIDSLKKEGYVFVSLPELLRLSPYK